MTVILSLSLAPVTDERVWAKPRAGKFMTLTGVCTIAAVVLSGCGGGEYSARKDKAKVQNPNILWIMAEDMGPEFGVYGEPESTTPVVDGLAAKGMTFDRAFTSAPICSISRSALYTGMYATSIGAHQHRTLKENKKPLPEGVELLTDRFRAAGYYTSLITKVEKPGGPDNWFKGKDKTDWNFTYDGAPYDGEDMADLAANQPFFAHVQFPETHRGKDWDMAKKFIDKPADPVKVDIPPYYPDHPITRNDWADYLNAVMAFDRKAGVVLRRLKEEGLSENTIVVLMADHGRAMSRGKQWLYDSGLHIPLVIYVPEGVQLPDGYKPGKRSDKLISGIDIPATSLALAGIDGGPVMEGRSFFGEGKDGRDYVYAARNRADSTLDYMRSVRGERFLYIKNYRPDLPYTQFNAYKETVYPVTRLMHRMHHDGTLGLIPSQFMAETKPAEELFDTVADPHNVKNLASDKAYAEELKAMRTRLAKWEEQTSDKGRIDEAPEIAKSIRSKTMRKRQPLFDDLVAKEGPWLPEHYKSTDK